MCKICYASRVYRNSSKDTWSWVLLFHFSVSITCKIQLTNFGFGLTINLSFRYIIFDAIQQPARTIFRLRNDECAGQNCCTSGNDRSLVPCITAIPPVLPHATCCRSNHKRQLLCCFLRILVATFAMNGYSGTVIGQCLDMFTICDIPMLQVARDANSTGLASLLGTEFVIHYWCGA